MGIILEVSDVLIIINIHLIFVHSRKLTRKDVLASLMESSSPFCHFTSPRLLSHVAICSCFKIGNLWNTSFFLRCNKINSRIFYNLSQCTENRTEMCKIENTVKNYQSLLFAWQSWSKSMIYFSGELMLCRLSHTTFSDVMIWTYLGFLGELM